jgi:DNA repair protein RecO (recombination protein O)
MLIKTKGIVFRTKKYSETSVITDIFTEEKGLRSYIINGVRSQKSKVAAGLLQIMSPVELIAYHREDKEIERLKEIKALHVYHSLPFDVRKSAVGMFMIELARKTIHGQEQHPELFQFLLENFLYLDETKHPFANIHLHFMVSLSGYLGFMPGGHYGAESPFFDMQEGIFTELQGPHPHWLSQPMSEKLGLLLLLPLERCHEISFGREERKAFLRNMLHFYRLHIEHFPQINSHEILEEVLV